MPIPPLLTPEQYADYLADPTDTRIEAVAAFVRARSGWHIAPSATVTEVFDGNGLSVLSLPTGHLTDVTTVVEDGVNITDQVQWSSLGLLRLGRRWTDRWRGVEVTFTHGYDPVPAVLVALVADVATRLPAPGDSREKKIGPFEFFVGESLFDRHELATIDHYAILPGP